MSSMPLKYADPVTITGTGPYTIPHEYGLSSEVEVTIQTSDNTLVEISNNDIILDPAESDTTGNLYISSSVATTYNGDKLYIRRASTVDQDWVSVRGKLQLALQNQLDLQSRAIQELQEKAFRSVTLFDKKIPYIVPEAHKTLIWNADGTALEAGPTADEISSAQTYAEQSGASKDAASLSAAEAALYDGPRVDDVAALLADTSLTLTTGQPGTVAVGDFAQTRKEGYAAQFADAAATDHDLVTAGGLKLYVQRHASGWPFAAFGATDADRWAGIAALVARASWRHGFREEPDVIDGGGATFTMTGDVHLPSGCRLENMKIENPGYTLKIGQDVGGISEIAWLGRGFSMKFTGTANFTGAMIAIPCLSGGGVVPEAVIDATSDTGNVARYGLYAGEEVAFGCKFLGTFKGGQCALRVGKERDQTSNEIAPMIAARSTLVNVLLCNPIGCKVTPNFEHSEAGLSLAITSETNGSATAAQNLNIAGGYMYNNGVENLTSDGVSAITIGLDVPGTEGWDQAGVITSGGNASGINISNIYGPSDHAERLLNIRALHGITIDGVTYGGVPTGSNQTKLARFAGSCAQTRIRNTRHNNSGTTTPIFTSTATNRVMVDLPGDDAFSPVVRGETTTGSLTYSARDGVWWVTDGRLFIDMHANWTAIASAGSGNIEVTLPALAVPVGGARAIATIKSSGFAYSVEGLVFPGENTVKLLRANTSTRIAWADLPASGNIHVSLNMPIDVSS